ncbi:response regulator [Chitinivibrio alkaliphilus]|uniref:Response regulator receiver protein n=1 Tax=Chitinivibrio alkaliphilus ACht1 TaxID=1313304 RepID=U7D5P2_9BACT|nr:response regulator [Chitinivibrio alkaliphilus]ERP30861.1 response regulator receiver protein [Chitinivibrio alkaliphilus ACht1]
MKILVVEDEMISAMFLLEYLGEYGQCDFAATGKGAIKAVEKALKTSQPYDLICLDIMMPDLDGQQALIHIRDMEQTFDVPAGKGAKIIMTTALRDKTNVETAYKNGCDGYLIKPIEKEKLDLLLKDIQQGQGAS